MVHPLSRAELPSTLPHVRAEDTERAISEIRASSPFRSYAEHLQATAMAALAQFIYKDPAEQSRELQSVSILFPDGLTPLPSAWDLDPEYPRTHYIQAFRHGDSDVIIAIRGTNLKADRQTKIANLLVDLGISRVLDSEEDIIGPIRKFAQRVKEAHGFNLPESALTVADLVVNNRLLGVTSDERASSLSERMVEGVKTGATNGGLGGTAFGTAAAAVLAGTGFGIPLALFAIASSSLFGVVTGGAVGLAAPLAAGCATAYDGFDYLLSYVAGGDKYITELKKLGLIKPGDRVTTCGHSLGGYLAAVLGAAHAKEIFSFNGPSCRIPRDTPIIFQSLDQTLALQDVTYNRFNMTSCPIASIGGQHGLLREFTLHGGTLPGPIAHHGIDVLRALFSVCHIPLLPEPSTVSLQPHPPTLAAGPLRMYPEAGVLLIEDIKED